MENDNKSKAFNRTLWNWNDDPNADRENQDDLLIEPCGIEIEETPEIEFINPSF